MTVPIAVLVRICKHLWSRVEQGTHDELMARNGAYTTLVKNQAPTSVKKDVDPRKIPVWS